MHLDSTPVFWSFCSAVFVMHFCYAFFVMHFLLCIFCNAVFVMHFLLCIFCYAVLALVLSTWLMGIHSMKNNFRLKNKNKLYKNNILVTKIYLHISKTFLAWISSYFRRLNWSDLRIKFSVENLLTLHCTFYVENCL